VLFRSGVAQTVHLLSPKSHPDPVGITPLALLAASYLLGQTWKGK